MSDGRVLMQRDDERGIARLTLANPERKNAYDPAMRRQLGDYLDELAYDDTTKVVLLRGEGGVFSTGADMNNAYSWYGEGAEAPTNGTADTSGATSDPSPGASDPSPGASDPSPGAGDPSPGAGDPSAGAGDRSKRKGRPSQRRRLLVDRKTFDFYQFYMSYPKVTVAEVSGFALGGGFELALMSDIAVVAADTRIGMPATRFLGPALGSLHMFFHRLGPVLARRLLLTGDTIAASEVAHLGVFTEVVEPDAVAERAAWYAEKVSRMPADGIVMAKEAFRLVEHLQAYQGEQVLSPLFHAYGTNLRFEEGEFNFVKARAEHGTRAAFELRDAHFEVPEP